MKPDTLNWIAIGLSLFSLAFSCCSLRWGIARVRRKERILALKEEIFQLSQRRRNDTHK